MAITDHRDRPAGKDLGASYRKLVTATGISNLGDGMSTIAYPWLASAVTRDPLLVALVVVAQRLPWLLFTLPAGVITDRIDRRKAMVTMNVLRSVLTVMVGLAVLAQQDVLPAPDKVAQVVGTQTGLYLVLLASTLLLGLAEVLHDNCGQTLLPSIVDPGQLERANGRMYSVEMAANTVIGPPVGTLLLVVAFSLPFFVDAVSFFVAAALVFTIPGAFRADQPADAVPTTWRQDLRDGFGWLWGHQLFRAMAIILGLMNMADMIATSMLVLFAQEVLGVTPLTFTLMGFGFAIGGIAGGYAAPWLSRTLGSGTCLALTLLGGGVTALLVGLSSSWLVVAVLFAVFLLLASTWNVITVSLRQAVIPPHLLGRVNSVYRFFAWGAIPIGALLGGLTVSLVDAVASRELALRSVFFVSAVIHVTLFVAGRRLLTTERLDAARAGATPTEVSAPA